MVTVLTIGLLEVFESRDRVPALIEHIIYMLKWIEPKPHPPLSIDLLALRHLGDCLHVLMQHIIVLLEWIEPEPDTFLLSRVIKSMRLDCSINLDTTQVSSLLESKPPMLQDLLLFLPRKKNPNEYETALRELEATVYNLIESWAAKCNGLSLEVAQQGVVRPLAANQGAPRAIATPEVRDLYPSPAAAKDAEGNCNEGLHLTRNKLEFQRMTAMKSIKPDPGPKDDGTVAIVGPSFEEDVGTAAVFLDLDEERADESVTRISLPSPENASSPPQDTAEKLQTPTACMLSIFRTNRESLLSMYHSY